MYGLGVRRNGKPKEGKIWLGLMNTTTRGGCFPFRRRRGAGESKNGGRNRGREEMGGEYNTLLP